MPRKFIDIYDLQDHTEEMTTLVQKEISEGGGSGSSVKIDKEVSFPYTQENSQYITTRLSAWNELDSLSEGDLLEKDIFCLDENSEPYRTTGEEDEYKTSGATCYTPISTANPFLYIYNDLKKNHNNYSFNYRVRHSWNFYNKMMENKYLKRITDSEEFKHYWNSADYQEVLATLPPKTQAVINLTNSIDVALGALSMYIFTNSEDSEDSEEIVPLSPDDIGETTYGCICEVFNYLVKPDKPIFYKINNSIYEAYPTHIAGKDGAQIGWAIFQIRDAFAWHDTLNLNTDAGSWAHEIGGTKTQPFEFYGYRNNPESIFLNGGIPVVSDYHFSTSSDYCSTSSYTVNPIIQAEFKKPTSSEVTMTDYEGNETTYSRLTKECTIYYASVDTSGSIATKSVTSTYDAALVTLDIPYTLESDIGKALEDF